MILIFDSHPVQYKAPIYQRLEQLRPGSFKVIYATDFPVRGHHDVEFGRVVTWDTPLLEGYPHQVLQNERGMPFQGFRSLSGRGVDRLLRKERPRAVIISQFIYAYDLATYLSCLRLGIPIWIRQETQDEAFVRPAWKNVLRGWLYRIAYSQVRHAFYFGQLNREHLLHHGIPAERMSFAPYSSPVGESGDASTRQSLRETFRERLGVKPHDVLLLFSGKLIDKKNPRLILEAMGELSPDELKRLKLILVGSGELESVLRARAAEFPGHVNFVGFVNQSEIPAYYLAADILILPSRRMGETWGLVVNEALQAGCSVIVSDAVGCHAEFGDWERVRVIPDNDAAACTRAIRELSALPRSLDWCAEKMKAYSTEAVALALAQQIDTVKI